METRERIKKLRKALGLRQRDLGKSLGLTDSTISLLESGKIGITKANIKLICSTFNVNEDWLRTGQGDMFTKEAAASQKSDKLIELFEALSPSAQDMLLDYTARLIEYEKADEGKGIPSSA